MQLYFKEFGQGEPLILLHGLFGSSDNWLGVTPKLAEKFHVFILDLRNHGQSPHAAEMNYPLLAEDVVSFLDARSLPEASVLGHSLGGKVAMQLALSHPHRVRRLIVADMSPRAYAPSHNKIFSALLALDLAKFQSRQQVEDALVLKIPDQTIRRFLLKNLSRDDAGTLIWKINLRGLAENYPRLGEAVFSSTPFAKPALFIRGGKSNFVAPDDEAMIRQLFSKAEIKTIPEAKHWVHADAPEEFVRLVKDFLC